MERTRAYENYPMWLVLFTGLFSILLYGVGLIIILQAGLVFALAYILYILILEYRLLRYHCTHCYYWGKTCGFGRGRLSSFLFKKGSEDLFCEKEVTFRDMIPDLLVSLIPVLTGIVLIILSFNIFILAGIIIILLLSTFGNSFIRTKLVCRSCVQKEDCPAYNLFNKENHHPEKN